MRQVLFHVPFTEAVVPPDGLPLYGFGAMLFLAFFAVIAWGRARNRLVGVAAATTENLAFTLFLSGIAGARVLYMWQYRDEMGLANMSVAEIAVEFFKIWNGGIVVYGAVFGGFVGYVVFRHYVLKRLGVNGWQLADAVAPLLAVGMAVGRVGCYLNGCCWGQVACEECQPVPLAAELGQFPLLPAHARKQLTYPAGDKARLPSNHGLQTTTGFTVRPRDTHGAADPRAVVLAVEPGSAAEQAGVKPGDKVAQFDGHPNLIVLELSGPDEAVEAAGKLIGDTGKPWLDRDGKVAGYLFDAWPHALTAQAKLLAGGKLAVNPADEFGSAVAAGNWPRGRNELRLVLDRDGAEVPVAFTPRTVTVFPTQVYETVSMLLLVGLLLAFQPFRRHDGQVMVVLMLGYAAHRFLNEAIRVEPTYAMGLTLSQWISVGIAAAAVLMELYLRLVMPKLPPGPQSLGARVATPVSAM